MKTEDYSEILKEIEEKYSAAATKPSDLYWTFPYREDKKTGRLF